MVVVVGLGAGAELELQTPHELDSGTGAGTVVVVGLGAGTVEVVHCCHVELSAPLTGAEELHGCQVSAAFVVVVVVVGLTVEELVHCSQPLEAEVVGLTGEEVVGFTEELVVGLTDDEVHCSQPEVATVVVDDLAGVVLLVVEALGVSLVGHTDHPEELDATGVVVVLTEVVLLVDAFGVSLVDHSDQPADDALVVVGLTVVLVVVDAFGVWLVVVETFGVSLVEGQADHAEELGATVVVVVVLTADGVVVELAQTDQALESAVADEANRAKAAAVYFILIAGRICVKQHDTSDDLERGKQGP